MKIVTDMPFDEQQWQTLRAVPDVDFLPYSGNADDLKEVGPEVDVFFPVAWTDYNRVAELCPNLKWIGLISAGYDMLNTAELKARGVQVTNARGVTSVSIAEDVALKVLLLARPYKRYFDNMKTRAWPHFSELPRDVLEITGMTAAVFGAGSIGIEIAKRLSGLGMRVLGYDAMAGERPGFERIVTDEAEVEALVAESDFVISAMPQLPQTVGFFNRKRFSAMKKSAFFINISRGQVVDEQDLVDALNEERIAGAALDVVIEEPLPPHHMLWTAKNILLTPHQAYMSNQTDRNKVNMAYDLLLRYTKGEALYNIVQL